MTGGGGGWMTQWKVVLAEVVWVAAQVPSFLAAVLERDELGDPDDPQPGRRVLQLPVGGVVHLRDGVHRRRPLRVQGVGG
jgi:hypothetical protein